MEIFEDYIGKHCNYLTFIEEYPSSKLKNIIVIPCCNEPELIKTIDSLRNCIKPQFHVEVIIVLNSSVDSENEVIVQNKITKKEIHEWAQKYNQEILKVYLIELENLPAKIAGVGYARKTGMDEAVRRYIISEEKNGIICGLDADSIVDENYLIEIEKLFLSDKECNGCSIYFEHPITGNQFSEEIYRRIIEYELFLRYYKLALQYIEFPHYHFTVGSSFAVSSNIYCKAGGMNKRKAGEDFYFLQKVMPHGNYYALNTTCVHPSCRPSDRVPFGTGAFISQYIDTPDKAFLTYNFKAFLNLKEFFNDIGLFYKTDNELIKKINLKYHSSLINFLELNNFQEALNSINSNTSTMSNFKKRFFLWFDAFRILKYLNFVHQHYYKKELVIESLRSYLFHVNRLTELHLDERELLIQLRNIEKTSS